MNNNRLRATLALVLGICCIALSPAGQSATLKVTNCNDDGPGSLRVAAFAAQDGDVVDLRSLTCRRIYLNKSGVSQIYVPHNPSIVGPGRDALTIYGGSYPFGYIFQHYGGGTLKLTGLSVAYGISESSGGCIQSGGNVELRDVRVHHCEVSNRSPHGGGIAAAGNVLLSRSSVFANIARVSSTDPEQDHFASGAGILAGGRLTMVRSQLYANRIQSGLPDQSGGAGAVASGLTMIASAIRSNAPGSIETSGDVYVSGSTFSENRAPLIAGLVVTGSPCGRIRIRNSTFSGNYSTGIDDPIAGPWGGFASAAYLCGHADIFNTTIASNKNEYCVAGALVGLTLHLESSIVAANSCVTGAPIDVGSSDEGQSIIGSHNLIGRSLVPLPADTIRSSPRLAPLAWYGGPTRTRALLCDSPAIGRGSNPLALPYDQRGPGYLRLKGARVDIGAFER